MGLSSWDIEKRLIGAPEKKWLRVWVLVVVLALPAVAYLADFGLGDNDSYYFLGAVCEQGNYDYTVVPILAFHALKYLPCDELLLKMLSVLSFFASAFILFHIVELWWPKMGWMGLLTTAITHIFSFQHFRFENEIFAYPLVFLSAFFFLRYTKKHEILDLAASLTILTFSFGFWGGGIYYLFAFAFTEPLLWTVAIPIAWFFWQPLFLNFWPRPEIVENDPIRGLLRTIFYGAVFLLSMKTRKVLHWPLFWTTLFLLTFGTLNPKFFILTLPFLALVIIHAYNVTPQAAKNNMLLVMLAFSIVPPADLILDGISPKAHHVQAVKETIAYNNTHDVNEYIANDWTYGHLIHYYGGKTKEHSGPNDHNLFAAKNQLVLTGLRLPCTVIKQYEFDVAGLNSPLTLYKC